MAHTTLCAATNPTHPLATNNANTARAPLDELLPWPTAALAHADGAAAEPDPIAAAGMPVAQEAYSFAVAHSRHDEAGDLLPGLCVLTELWLSKVGLAMFPDTAPDALDSSLSAYFNSARVQQALLRGGGAGGGVVAAAPAAAGAVASAVAAVAGGVTGGIGRAAAAVKAAIAGATTEVQSGGGASTAVMARGGGGGGGGGAFGGRQQRQWQDAGADGAHGTPEQWAPPAGVDAIGALPPSGRSSPAPGAAGRYDAAFDDLIAEEGASSAARRRGGASALADADPWARGASAAGTRPAWGVAEAGVAQPAWQVLIARAAALLGRPAVAGAVGGVVLAALALQAIGGRRNGAGATATPAAPWPAAAVATSSRAGTLDAGAAARLVRGYQEAKWRALGPDWDASALEAVADGAALAHLRAASDQYAARGWFQRFRLHACGVRAVTPAGAGAARVEATVKESSSMFGVDGRRGDSATSEYDVVYRAKRGADGRWRVTNFKVVGREPGAGGWLARLFGLPGGGGGGGASS